MPCSRYIDNIDFGNIDLGNIDFGNIDFGNIDLRNSEVINSANYLFWEDAVTMTEFIDADEAAGRLGIKKATLYAYVSRGQLTRQKAVDGRHSLFDSDEVDALSRGRRRPLRGELGIAIESGITRVHLDHFGFRGQAIDTLVDRPFTEVAMHIWALDGPSRLPAVPPALSEQVAAVRDGFAADAFFIDRLRAAVPLAASSDPFRSDLSKPAVVGAGQLIIATMLASLPPQRSAKKTADVAEQLWVRLSPRKPREADIAALNTALVVLIDHGLATSTFAARVAASVRGDAYSVVVAGLGAVGGVLHGAASSQVHRLFQRANELGSGTSAVGEILRRGELVPGFGHAVYKAGDPRFTLLDNRVRKAFGSDPRFAHIGEIHAAVATRSRVLPNIDFALGALTYLSDMPADAGEAIFALSRTAGWLAHALEEYDEEPMRFRPQARYVGPVELDT